MNLTVFFPKNLQFDPPPLQLGTKENVLTLSFFLVDLPRDLVRILSNISDGVFCENTSRLSVGNHFRKKASS